MADIAGVINQVSVEKELTYGTPVTPTLSVPVDASDGIQIKQELVGIEAIKGTAPKNKHQVAGKQSYEGSFVLQAYPKALGYFLLSLLGTDTPATTETGVYNHVLTESPTKVGLTVEQMVGLDVRRFAGFVPSKMKLTAKVGAPIQFQFDGLAKGQATATAISKTYETSPVLKWTDIATLSVGGTDIKALVDSFEINYENGAEMFYGLGAVTPAKMFTKQSSVSGKITAIVDTDSEAIIPFLLAGTEKEIILTITGTDTIGVSSHYQYKVTISKCMFSGSSMKLSYGANMVDLEFTAREDSTNGLMKTELQNTTATY